MISIIIPAHNEENVITRCLNQLVEGFDKADLEVLVVCNGCSDKTAEVSRSVHQKIRVIEITTASKIAALNEGDRQSNGFPRIYLDADIKIDWNSIKNLADTLNSGTCLAAAPRMTVNYENRNFVIRSYYKIWCEVPYFKEEMIGSGIYALNAEGRKRFDQFPQLTADDEFVRRLFTKEERKTADNSWFEIVPPKTVERLIKIKTRALFGILELEKISPKGLKKDEKNFIPLIKKILFSPALWIPFVIYVLIRIKIKHDARKRIQATDIIWAWDRDDTARE